MGNKLLMADYRGEINIGDITMSCAVLEDGTRVVSEAGLVKNLGSSGGKNYKLRDKQDKNEDIGPMPMFVSSKALEPFIEGVFEPRDLLPIKYTSDGKNELQGYDATIIPKVCEVWLKAREYKTLQASQLPKAQKAEMIMRSLAKIGITALVDEATGYQYDREKYELQKILDAYIAEELRPWKKTFPDELYRQFFRLNGWDFNVRGIKKRPGVIGTWTNQYIYDQLPDGVRKELKAKVPKSKAGNDTARMHQMLSNDIGADHLKDQINQVLPLMRVSDTFEEFKHLFQKSVERQKGQYELPFDTDEKGHIIEEIDRSTLSKHNRSLKKALEFNPKNEKKKQPKLF